MKQFIIFIIGLIIGVILSSFVGQEITVIDEATGDYYSSNLTNGVATIDTSITRLDCNFDD